MRLKGKTILITCGPTWIALDPVRVISNRSSGELGHSLAKALANKGGRVTLLEGPVQRPWTAPKVQIHRFCYYDELAALLRRALKKSVDIVIHAAAVSDYRPQEPFSGKVSSGKRLWPLRLVPTAKIIRWIKKLRPGCLLVGFKLVDALEQTLLPQTVRDLFTQADCDLVVINATHGTSYRAWIIDRDLHVLHRARSRAGLTQALVKTLEKIP